MKSARAFLFFLLAIFVVFNSTAAAQAPDDLPITYFLVDASGTMEPHEATARDMLSVAVDLVAPEERISITFFGADPGASSPLNCDDPVDLGAPTDSNVAAPAFPALGRANDKTSIGTALIAALEVASKKDRIVLITDGLDECGASFPLIRAAYPNTPIRVLIVGNRANRALDQIEFSRRATGKPETNSATEFSFRGPLIETRSEAQDRRAEYWNLASWWEKYLWVFCYLLFCLSAFLLSLSYGAKTQTVKDAIDKLERFKRNQASDEEQSKTKAERALPEYLADAEIEKSGKAYTARSRWALVFAIVVGVPLAILDGWSKLGTALATSVIGIACLTWMFIWIRKQKPNSELIRRAKKRPIVKFFAKNEYWILAVALIITVSTILYFSDYDRARDAAWVPLSSGFSAALTILASTPFLFSGSQWWGFQKEKQSYYILSDGATREELRRREQEAKEIKREWDNHREIIKKLTFENPLRARVMLKHRRVANFESKLGVVTEWLKEQLIKAGGDEPSDNANDIYHSLLRNRGLRPLILAMIEVSGLVPEKEAELWNEFAKSLKNSWATTKLEMALTPLYRLINSKQSTESSPASDQA